MPVADNSFTQAAVTGTPYQSSNQQAKQALAAEQKRGARTGLRLQQHHSSIIPDELSEGNRRDLLNGMFFPGKMSFHNSREGSASGRSASHSSLQGSVAGTTNRNGGVAFSNRIRMKSLNPLSLVSKRRGVHKEAGASIIEGHNCKGKKFCSVSDMSELGARSPSNH